MSVINIANESLPTWYALSGVATTTPTPLGDAYPVRKCVVIRANAANTSDIYVSPTGVGGFVLAAGESTPPIFVDNIAKIYVSANSGNQPYSYTWS